jgi:hypothetical protein
MASNYYQQNLGTSSNYPLELTGPVNITNLTYIYPPIISTNSNFTSGTNINTSFTFTIANQNYGNGTYIYSCQNQYVSQAYLNLLVNGIFGSTANQGWEPSNDGTPYKYSTTSPYALVNNSSGATTATNSITYYGLWLQVQLPQSIYINGVYIAPIYGAPSAMPGIIQVVGSTNGSTWEYIGQISGIIPVIGENKLYPLNILSLSAYNYFRFIFTNVYGSYGGIRLTQFYVTGATTSSALQMNPIQKIINGSGSIVTSNILPQSFVGIGITNPVCVLNISGAWGTGQGSSYNTNFPLQIIDTNQQVATTQGVGLIFGSNRGSLSAGYLQYIYTGSNAQTNYLRLGITGSGNQLYVNAYGYVGIGMTNPAVPLQVKGVGPSLQAAQNNADGNTNVSQSTRIFNLYFNSSNLTLVQEALTYAQYNGNVSGLFSHYVVSNNGFAISSDRRIKTNIINADTSIALNKIMQLPLMTYNYTDYIEDGTQRVYGMIAQEVNEILPEAITFVKHIIPSIYKLATNINLSNDEENVIISVDIPETSELKIDGIVELIIEGKEDKYQTKVISFTSSQLVVPKWENFDDTKKVFVYGPEVNDFHVLDKPYLGVLCMGGIQELTKRNDALQQIVLTQQSSIDTLQQQVSILMQQIATLLQK